MKVSGANRQLRWEVAGLCLIAGSLLAALCLFSPSSGLVTSLVEKVLRITTGEGRYLFPFVLAYWGIRLLRKTRIRSSGRILGGLIIFLVSLVVLHMFLAPGARLNDCLQGNGGGLAGAFLYFLFYKSFGMAGAIIIVITLTLVGVLLSMETPVQGLFSILSDRVARVAKGLFESLKEFVFTVEDEAPDGEEANSPLIIDHAGSAPGDGQAKPEDGVQEPAERNSPVRREEGKKGQANRAAKPGEYGLESLEQEEQSFYGEDQPRTGVYYRLPSSSLLSRPVKNKIRDNKDIAENIKILEDTLESFGVKVKVTQVSRGPAITRYEVHPPAGVKVSRIVSLADDIALSMASPDVRIEAPIPGKAAVGIEVPNNEISTVHLRELLETGDFKNAAAKLTVVLGKDIAGNPVIADLARMPHLLIAGATGSGKSVCLNTMIASILFKSVPTHVKFLIIDPKMVELTNYNGIPHLISPVVTDAKKAATALRWAVKEMEHRYELFAASGVRDITRYNAMLGKKDGIIFPLPFIIVIIDELADLMMVAPADVEDSICRLAQMARAAGIHLVVATQRPSVDVITGLIKSNIPSRISFAVSSQVDSRTILDMGGAEKLLGKGDLLFFPVGAPKPIRLQGAYLSDRDVEALVSFWKKQAEPVYDDKVTGELQKAGVESYQEDELLPRAVEIFIETGHASISLLQRRLHIGYARAARLIDIMEIRGIVGGYEGSKPRSVLMTLEQYEQVFKNTGSRKKIN